MAEFEAVSDEKDPGWRWEEIVKDREPIAEEDNSAPKILAAAKSMPSGWPNKKVVAPVPGVPPVDPLETRLRQIEPQRRLDDALAAELRAELKELQPALAIARQVTASSHGRYDVAWAADVYSTLLPHIQEAHRGQPPLFGRAPANPGSRPRRCTYIGTVAPRNQSLHR